MIESLPISDFTKAGTAIYKLANELYPICRSITGDGFYESLQVIKRHVPLEIFEVPTGTQVFDWTIPKEWNVRDAFIRNNHGEKIVDFQKSNLHLMSYSTPLNARLSMSELKPHLFSLPDHPQWIPYRTSYYKENWGFCLSQAMLESLEDSEYDVLIDSCLEDGFLRYGECYLPGEVDDEVLISCHCCHPSLCNDNLSGMVVATFLANQLEKSHRHYSYRFLFIPGTDRTA